MDNLFEDIDETDRLVPDTLIKELKQEISDSGFVPFSRYMEMALYHPKLGYYRNGSIKFGSDGDFVTAPEVSPLFAQCLARQCLEIFSDLSCNIIIEFGAGSGVLAGDLLSAIHGFGESVAEYLIIELSAELRYRQQCLIQEHYPEWYSKVRWLDVLPEGVEGVIIANEVLDAMPCEVFRMDDEVFQCGVSLVEGKVVWDMLSAKGTRLEKAVQNLNVEFANEYQSEINLYVQPWIKSLSQCLNRGVVLLIDYGFPRHEYYHPQRSAGTIMCHYRHHSFSDPLMYPGLHDITAHVDFTSVAEAADASGFDVMGFTHQAAFLHGCGLDSLINTKNLNTKESYKQAQQVKLLTMPSEMGELFKVMALGKGVSKDLMGFSQYDQLHRL